MFMVQYISIVKFSLSKDEKNNMNYMKWTHTIHLKMKDVKLDYSHEIGIDFKNFDYNLYVMS